MVVVVVVEEEEVEVEVVVVVVLVVVALLPLRAPPCVSRGRRMLGYLLASHYLMWRFFSPGSANLFVGTGNSFHRPVWHLKSGMMLIHPFQQFDCAREVPTKKLHFQNRFSVPLNCNQRDWESEVKESDKMNKDSATELEKVETQAIQAWTPLSTMKGWGGLKIKNALEIQICHAIYENM